MARYKGSLFTSILDVSKRAPIDARELVTSYGDLINPTVWHIGSSTNNSLYNGLRVSVNENSEYRGIYFLTDRTAITEENYTNYLTAKEKGEDIAPYFSMWVKVLLSTDNISGSNLIPVDGTIIIGDSDTGEKTIKVAISSDPGNSLTAVDGGLFVPTPALGATAGEGIKIEDDNVISIKLADITHGLKAVDGALTLGLATQTEDGAMSKEDKVFVEQLKSEIEDIRNAIVWSEFIM